jgi:hypothetical protein
MPLSAWIPRRVLWTAALLLATLAADLRPLSAAETVALAAPAQVSPARVKVVFEVDGQMSTRASQEQPKGQQLELKAKGQYLYEERLAEPGSGEALRYYEQAEAEVAVDRRPSQPALREQRRFIAVDARPNEIGFRSLQGALTREELELIELPGGSQWVDQLLPGRQVAVGESWTHDDPLLARLLNLSSVTINEVSSQLQAIDRGQQIAQLTLTGKALGYVADVLTEIQLQGKYNVDLKQQRVTWLALGIREQRAAGLIKPGLQVQARLRMLIEPTAPLHLTSETLEAVVTGAPEPTDLLEYQPDHGRYTLMHDRRWHVLSVRPELTVMQMIEDGQLVAQCNLRSLPARSDGQAVSLSQFQQEIRTALGSAAQQVVDSHESMQHDGVRQLRVSVVGEVATAPIHWIYYQLTDPSRQVVTCVFTMSGQNIERFGTEDVSFISSLTLNSPETPPADESNKVARNPDTQRE